MKEKPRHEIISRELLSEILAGKYDSSQRLPSEAQLVKRYGVSRPTIGRALQDLREKGIIERKAGSGTYLRLQDGSSPRSAMASQLGLIVPGLGEVEIFEVICGELASLARVHDFGMHWGGNRSRGDAPMSIADADDLCTRYIEKGVRGVFFAPFEYTTDNEAASRRLTERLTRAGIVVVLLDRDISVFPQRSDFDLVGVDNFAGGYLLADHLLRLGAKRLAFLSRPFSATTVDARRCGAAAAMQAHGLDVPRDFLKTGDASDIKFVRQLTAGNLYDAVICTNDHTAAQLIQSLAKLNIHPPQKMRVVGFDDVRFATLLSTPLSTMHQPCREIALTAFNAMRERLLNPSLPPRSLLLTPRLVVRESCGAYAKSAK